MHGSPHRSGRIVVLVLLLFAACYVADWSDDYFSYYNAARYSSFASANGLNPRVSGGSLNTTNVMAALALREVPTQPSPSALEAVFGAPLGSSQPASEDGAQSSLTRSSRRTFSADSSLGTSMRGFGNSRAGVGRSGNSGYGLTGRSSGTGFSSGAGMSAAAASIFGPQ